MAAIITIEGIGPTYAERLAQAQVGSTQALLERGRTRVGRRKLARECGLTGRQVLDWVNRADLLRVRGVGEEYADLLEAAGVDTVVELAHRRPEHLHPQLAATNQTKHCVRRLPSLVQVTHWVRAAQKLPRGVEY